ncbi:peptide-methionine (R)-S-oxide reductase MsrB [Oricola sp.]|uniref:peptide-methionine (R)-S-oxide reductase MsrB n=1 Tax=Oricola sp. TaxID=1979950 RepID=UPI0025FAA6E8|nr:peptide-methionine (R)-S-oxide reductase MsrB [Oricola sp.]MCI5077732.1 peptide-methionine (R)-S-oxide reductase MsrB [Oricola sp.]
MKRRSFLALGATAALTGGVAVRALAAGSEEEFEIMKTEEEWRNLLTEEQFAVMRKEATERAFTSPLNEEKRKGVFHCAACDLALFSSEAKFDSGTGWPSFFDTLPDAVGYKRDFKLILPRTEEHCRRCGGHLGHVFNDGPKPTGKRHCINGVALAFKPAEDQPA